MMLPMVFKASMVPTALPLSSRLSTVYFTREGVTVPKISSGHTNSTRQAAKAAQTRKFFVTNRASTTVMPAMTYLPSRGMQAIHTAANRMRRYSRSGLGSRSADRPPHTLPRAMAIMMVPMMMSTRFGWS